MTTSQYGNADILSALELNHNEDMIIWAKTQYSSVGIARYSHTAYRFFWTDRATFETIPNASFEVTVRYVSLAALLG